MPVTRGERYTAPKKKRKAHPASRVRITGSERAEVRRIVGRPGGSAIEKLRPAPEVYTSGPRKGEQLPSAYYGHAPKGRDFGLGNITRTAAELTFGNTASALANRAPLEGAKYRVDPIGLALETGGFLTGPLRILGAGAKAGRAVWAGKTVKEVAEAAKAGHKAPIREATRAIRGGKIGDKLVPKPVVPKPPKTKVREALGPARRRRAEQKRLYSEERTARVGKAEQAYEEAGGGVAGQKAALGELKGELPRVQFANLREGRITQDDFDSLAHQIWEHPELQTFQKIHAVNGLLDAFNKGHVPQPSQIKLLQTVFGQDAASELSKLSKARKAGQVAVDVLGVPRSLMASFDVSAPFRQGLVAGARHPLIFSRDLKHMFRALTSENYYQSLLDEIHARPSFPLMEESGVKFTELGGDLSKREEQFISNYAEKITGGRRGPVRASGRAYTGFLDRLRADMFDHQLKLAAKAGVNVEDKNQLRSIARLVNSATGRGDLGPVESWAPALNTIFFSPRLIGSRVNMLNPVWYATLKPHARKQALRSMIQLGGAVSALLATAAYFTKASVGTDPRSSDFAKLRVGSTRMDVLGGFQQYVRVGTQIYKGETVNPDTGAVSHIGTGFGDKTRAQIFSNFMQGKFAPPVSFINDFFQGTDFSGQPFSVKKAALQRVTPLVAQDAYDLYGSTDSVPLAMLGYSISAFGIGMQTYAAKDTAKKKFQTWHTQAEADYKAIYHLPLPATVVRAKRDADAIALASKNLPGYGHKRTPEQENAYEAARYKLLVDYLLTTYPQYASYRAQYESVTDPLAIHTVSGSIESALTKPLRDFSSAVGAYKLRKRTGH